MTALYRFKVDKLIRDKMPNIMRSKGIQVSERVMETEEYIKRLKNKLVEEVQEAISVRNSVELGEELADILEVIQALSEAEGISFSEIEKARIKKKQEKGGFDEKIYNAFVEMSADNKSMAYYREQPEKYPLEIIED